MKTDDLNYSAEILRLRKAEGLSLSQLAELCGLDKNNIHKYETGKRVPSELTFLLIIGSMGYTVKKKIIKV